MIYLSLPIGSLFGWGVCGKYITRALSSMTDVKLLTEKFDIHAAGDELDFVFLVDKLIKEPECSQIMSGQIKKVDCPVLHAIHEDFKPWLVDLGGKPKAGYTFFEDIPSDELVDNVRNSFDIVVTGSRWCAEVLREKGLENITTIIQGVDPQLFNSFHSENELFPDSFVIFSGGKFELRKGHDLVIKAYKTLQDKYKNVILVHSWFNPFSDSLKTMNQSPHINFCAPTMDHIRSQADIVNKVLIDFGIDMNRVIGLSPRFNSQMPRIYKNTDVGLFPNRCEGGTNLVMMEYMACGKPVVASYNTGHRDILTDSNSLMINYSDPITVNLKNEKVTWDDPNIDEIISNLEWAYHNKGNADLKQIAWQAGNDLSKLTWQRTGQQFYDLLKRAS